MNSRAVLFALLGVVATAAAVLSFSALRDLALMCGFVAQLAWLLPVVIDAGAAAGSLVWLGGRTGDAARRFARVLALALLSMSVAANALGHGLEAFSVAPVWWVVVLVSSVAPAVLGAVVHLAVLVGRPVAPVPDPDDLPVPYELTRESYDAGLLDEHRTSHAWDDAPPAETHDARAAELIAEGAGRRRLARELDISEYEARRLIASTRVSATEPADHPQQLELNGSSLS